MYLIKKLKWFLIVLVVPYIFLICVCTIRTNDTVQLTGDITPVRDLIEVETDYEIKGSFNTTYVVSFKGSTLFQNYLVNNNKENTVIEYQEDPYKHLETYERYNMSRIQHDSSVEASIIYAYRSAMEYDDNVHLDFHIQGFIISWRYKTVDVPRIGDIIIGVNGIYAKEDIEAFTYAFNNKVPTDELNVLRGEDEIKYNTSDLMINSNGEYLYQINGYTKYYIDYSSSIPKIKVNYTNVGGPSGGLLQSLQVFNCLTSTDYTYGYKIGGTGTINANGYVGAIGAVEQKIYTCATRNVAVFLCPRANYKDAFKAYIEYYGYYNIFGKNDEDEDLITEEEMAIVRKYKEGRMALVCVDKFSDATAYLASELANI